MGWKLYLKNNNSVKIACEKNVLGKINHMLNELYVKDELG